jgi:hypothetical protein
MKTLRLKLLVLFIAIGSLNFWAMGDEFTKKISKSYDVNKDVVLEVKNKFGKIHCTNWDKNAISIEVTITVDASSQEKANKYLDRINIEINGSSSRVTAVTNMEDKIFDNNNNQLSVDYMISIPKTISVDLDNKFGDILLDEVMGSSQIELGYGNLKCKRLTGDNNELDIKFSEGYIGYLGGAELDLQYSELDIDEANRISAESKFSEFQIGKVDALTLDSGYDDDMIGIVRDLDIEANFSEVEIRSVSERLVADFDYGELTVKEISSGFTLVDITNSFSGAKIGFEADASYKIVATVKMGDLDIPKDKARLSVIDLSYTSNKYEGIVGDNENTTSRVLIDSKNSGVTLYYR